ncbi:Exocyst complex component SEC8 [Vitis vinifera]|uniref:Exocyst complex component SEC8 n=1 Tax=Vitis vinifera TaxID=29760 RepID=A0A438DU29_VITVI|nr:Exocyst complex component SEC8 [Vitis vinifera]
MSEGVVRSLGIGRFLDWGALDASGVVGGILICWDNMTLNVLEMEVGQFSISCRFRNVEDGFVWMFTRVYGPFSREERGWLWEELGAIRSLWNDPWCLGGDFNVILSQRKRSRQGRLTGAMRRFAQIVDELELLDLPMQGGLGTVVRGNASFRLATKLKELKQRIKVWNRDVFGRLEVNRNSALQQAELWDGVESERSLSEGETELKKEAKETYKKWVLLEETHWRQLSRELWLKEGDKNTCFFHRMTNGHRRNNSLDRIKINRVWLTEEQEVREEVVNAFQQLLLEEQGWRADIEGLHLHRLNFQEAENLEVPFSEEEIHSALLELNGDKATGPDGFTVAFWQACWDFVKEKILELFKEFCDQRSFAKSLNTTFLVLISKKGGAEDLGDFLPISILGGLYKLLAKVLANRLKKVLGKVVSEDQSAFVKGRQIFDVSLIANEVLHKMGFGFRWMEWIWRCISTAKFSVLVNGVPAGFFSNTKGLRQGDPLSPYLFVLGMEVLSALLRRPADGGFISGSRKDNLTFLSWTLAWFEATSGLRINLAKSELIPVGEVEEIEEMAVELGYCSKKAGKITKRLSLGRGSLERKVHLINWEVVCAQKEKGGLGLRKIILLNKALLGKWVWRFAIEKDNLWKKVLLVKYGHEGFGWRTNEVRGTYGVGVWKEILKEACWCWDNFQFKVGKGTKIKFWTDHWCDNAALSQIFPQLFTLAVQRNATVNEVWHSSYGQGVVRVLWEIILALFGVLWVFPETVKEAVLEKQSYMLIGRHDIEKLMRCDPASACLPNPFGQPNMESNASDVDVEVEMELCDLLLSLRPIKQENLIRDDNKLILLASLSDSLEYVADSIERQVFISDCSHEFMLE